MRYTSVGALLVGVAVAAGVVGTGESVQGRPLLRAVENQEKAKSYRSVRRVTIPDSPIQEGDTKIYYSDGRCRIDGVAGDFTVADSATKKMVYCDPHAKTVHIYPISGVGSKHAATSDEVRKAIAKKEVKDLGVRVVDGRRLRAYRVDQPADQPGGIPTRTTYWLDAKRDLLVRSESVGPSPEFLVPTGEPPLKPGDFVPQKKLKPFVRTEVVEYLGFDEDLDPALFDTTPPAGYKVIDETPPAKP